jgi:hypothetical protein
MASALSDHVPPALGNGGERVRRQMVGPAHVGNGEIETLTIPSAWRWTRGTSRSSFAISRVALRVLASSIAAAGRGQLRLSLSTS